MNRVNILGVEIDNLSLNEAVNEIDRLVKTGVPSLIVTANPEIIWVARSDPYFEECLRSAKLVTADGIGVVLAARIIGSPIKQRVTGIDLTTALFAEAVKKNYTFYFVGGKPGIAERAAEEITKRYPGIQILGTHHGYFKDDTEIIKDVTKKKPDILLVALGMGKQERWIRERVKSAGVPVSIGVGGSFDVFSGEVRRAPVWMQRAGVEWLYRLICQPSRIGRMLQLPKFLVAVIISKITGKES